MLRKTISEVYKTMKNSSKEKCQVTSIRILLIAQQHLIAPPPPPSLFTYLLDHPRAHLSYLPLA